jgi:hypothetical protein
MDISFDLCRAARIGGSYLDVGHEHLVKEMHIVLTEIGEVLVPSKHESQSNCQGNGARDTTCRDSRSWL